MTWTTSTGCSLSKTQGTRLGKDLSAGIRPSLLLPWAILLVVGLVLALLPIRWVVAGLTGIAIVGLTLVRPQMGLYLLCFAIPFGSLFEMGIGSGITVGVSEALIGLTTAAWLAHRMAWRKRTAWPQLTTPLLLFIGAAGLSLLNATSLPHAFKEIVKWIEFLVVLLMVANMGDYRQSQKLVACLLLAGIGQAILGAYQFLTRSGPEFFAIGRFIRAYGTFEQPNPYAGYLGLVAPLALALILVSLRGQEPTKLGAASELNLGAIPGWLKWLALGSFVAVTIGIGMSASRGAWLAFGAAFVAVNVSQSRKGAAIFVGLIVLALSASLLGNFRVLPIGITQRLTSFLPLVGAGDVRSIEVTDANYASLERLAFWQAALDMWRDCPVLGVGLGNYHIAYARHSLPKWRMALGHAHNYYLNVAAETGLVGLLAYLALWAAAAWQTIHAIYRSRDPLANGNYLSAALSLGALGVLVHVSVHNVVDNLWVHNMYIHVAMVLGLVQSQFVSDPPLGDYS